MNHILKIFYSYTPLTKIYKLKFIHIYIYIDTFILNYK